MINFYLFKVSKSMSSVVEGLNHALEANQMEKVSMIMDKFEVQVENLSVQTSYMESSMMNSATLTTPADQVSELMQQVADEHGLELGSQLNAVSSEFMSPLQKKDSTDPLSERLAKLRNTVPEK